MGRSKSRIATRILVLLIFTAFGSRPTVRTRGAAGPELTGTAYAAPVAQARLVESYGKLPLSFEANQGQVSGGPGVRFLSRGAGYTLFLTGDEAVLALKKASEARSKPSGVAVSPAQAADPTPSVSFRHLPPDTRHLLNHAEPRAVLRMKLVGANPTARVSGLEELPGKSNYFIDNDPKKWRTNVPTYAKVKYAGVYPGVDLVYYGNQRELEYDFVVAPGASPKVIRLAFDEGAGVRRGVPVRVAENGDLVIPLDDTEIRFRKPVVYQPGTALPRSSRDRGSERRTTVGGEAPPLQRQFLDGHYILKGKRQISFEVARYDPTRPLVIDPVLPVLSYSTYLGGSNLDLGNAIAVDSSGNVYVAGTTVSIDFPTAGPLQGTCSSCAPPTPLGDAFVAKLNPTLSGSASLVYSTYLGGNDLDEANGIAVDSTGNIYVTGRTFSINFPTTVGAYQTTSSSGSDAFVTQIAATGASLLYSTYLAGIGSDEGLAIALDTSNKVYVTGDTASANFPTTPGAFQTLRPSTGPVTDAFVAKLDPTLSGAASLVYSTFLGGAASDDQGTGIVIDSSGNAYVAGQTSSFDFPTTAGAFDRSCGVGALCDGTSDAFVTKLKADGSGLLYSTFLGGGDFDRANAIALDGSGNAYVTGITKSPDFPTTPGAFRPTAPGPGGFDAFVTKLNSAGSALIFSTYLGGVGFDASRGIALDALGNAYVAGSTGSADFPLASPTQAACGNCPSTDAFVTKLNAAGSALIFSTYLGGNGADGANGIAVDSSGNPHVVGSTESSNFPTSAGAFNSKFGGNTCGQSPNTFPCDDAFVAKLSNLVLPVINLSSTGFNFGNQIVGTSSAAQVVTLTSAGDAVLNITSIGATGDFAESNTCGTSLAAGLNCTISLTFTPTATGTRNGTVAIQDNAFGSPHTISLGGTGTGSVVSLSSTNLAFGNQTVGATSAAQAVTLNNAGNPALTITSIGISGDYAQTNNCGSSVAAGGKCTINVTFTPTAGGSRAGTLTVTDNGGNSPQTATLTGTGTDFTIAAAAGSSTTATVTPGQPATYKLSFAGTAGFTGSLSLVCTGAPTEAVCTPTPASLTLNGTTPASSTVMVTTTAPSLGGPSSHSQRGPLNTTTPRGFAAFAWALLFLTTLIALGAARRPPASLRAGAPFAAIVFVALLWSACGGGGSVGNLGTPAGSYTLTVTATFSSGSGTLKHTQNLTLTVQ